MDGWKNIFRNFIDKWLIEENKQINEQSHELDY